MKNVVMCLVVLMLGVVCARAQAEQGAVVDFTKSIRPLLADRCFHCHGPDSAKRKAGLRLDIEADAKKKVIVPGRPDESELIARICAADVEKRMPPKDSPKPALTAEDIALIRQWIAEGAQWPQHWAYVAPRLPEMPAVKNTAWPLGDLDRLILAKLEAEGLAPSPEADRETLIRRLSFDLIGLPPTLEEVDAFVNDASPNAYEKVVDRLLASPHYGERMALDWLDGARYADTNGYQNDFQRQMWLWRDWVIAAYNDNMPFDEFTIEQLAGDLLPNATDQQRIATGFNRNNRSTTEGGSIEEEWHVENLVDRVETTSNVFLGLTMGCGRCHDHKYDPISQREFYQFFAFFNSTKDTGFYEETRGNTGPTVSMPSEENKQRIAEHDALIAAAEREFEEAKKKAETGFDTWKQSLLASVAPPAVAPVYTLALDGKIEAASGAAKYAGANGPVWGEGVLGAALELDGTPDAHVDAGQAVTFHTDAPFSVSLWARVDGPGALCSKMDDAAGFRGVDILSLEDGKLAVHLINHWTDNALKVFTDEPLPKGAWAHLTVTYDGLRKAKGVMLYVDGQEVRLRTEVDGLAGPIETEQPLRLGRRSGSAFFKGALADFRVYGRVLAKDEIGQLIQSGLSASANLPATDARNAALDGYFKLAETVKQKVEEKKLEELRKAKNEYVRDKVPSVMVMEEAEKPRETYRLIRGQYDQPDKSELLHPAVPGFLPPLPAGTTNNRLGLAKWLVDPANPLTARVTVNRIWARFFGQGLIKTLDNFGVQSEPLANQALLDWLASTFESNGWDMKALQKQIVMSATYRQGSAQRPELLTQDPDNLLLARGPRFRLSAELVRDNALAISGLLAPKIGGPSVKPYQPEGLWAELAGGAGEGPYIQGTGEDLYRRSLYTYRKRTVSHPTVSTFDAPSWEICRVYRARTNTPLQSLALLNDTTYVEAARNLAQRLLTEARPDLHERLRLGFRLATGRAPNPQEEEILTTGMTGYLDTFKNDPAAAETLTRHGDSQPPADLDKIELAAYTAVSGVLLNMDTTITKE